jgi:hypothetical protein
MGEQTNGKIPKDPGDYLLEQAARQLQGGDAQAQPQGFKAFRLTPEMVAEIASQQRAAVRAARIQAMTNMGIAWLIQFTATGAAFYTVWHWLR